ncbi:phage portal protein [Sphingomicrobium aestuariivivum]|uniref:phage portal protein n=1 Tax=Sphingomicrobium aestuariivivum TaxID=1582356 RepID=UPI001FD6B28C|nr:phage portal protein [Sphingomicrobium aestuariivivum]MCJ8191766.1 phage portal protein [Sphingomicrobium aestuariivivum]
MKWLDKWLGAKSAPGGGTVLPIRDIGPLLGGMRTAAPTAYADQLCEVFERNPVGHRAVRLVAGAVGSLAIDTSGEGAELAAPLLRRNGLLETVALHLLLHGNAYVRLAADPEGIPTSLHCLRPERVATLTDREGWPTGYAYRGREVVRYPARDAMERLSVVHIRAFHPGKDIEGQGCLEAAIGPAMVHNAASRWNKALLDNAARPSGALVHDPGDGTALTDKQFDRLKAELAEQYEGSGNAGRPLLLDGGLRWQAFSLSPADMDFIKLKEAAARDIALAFGVPPVLLGLPGDATFANGREAGRALYRQTVLPLARKILRALETQLADWIEPVRFEIDEDQLSELSEDRSRLWSAVNAADFLSRSEKRAMLGFPDGELAQ